MTYRLSHKAEEDIIQIFLVGTELFGESQAEQYHDQLELCFQFLAGNPFAAPERHEIKPSVRIHPVATSSYTEQKTAVMCSLFGFGTNMKIGYQTEHDSLRRRGAPTP